MLDCGRPMRCDPRGLRGVESDYQVGQSANAQIQVHRE